MNSRPHKFIGLRDQALVELTEVKEIKVSNQHKGKKTRAAPPLRLPPSICYCLVRILPHFPLFFSLPTSLALYSLPMSDIRANNRKQQLIQQNPPSFLLFSFLQFFFFYQKKLVEYQLHLLSITMYLYIFMPLTSYCVDLESGEEGGGGRKKGENPFLHNTVLELYEMERIIRYWTM